MSSEDSCKDPVLKPLLAEICHPNTFIKRGTLDDVQDYVAKDSNDLDFFTCQTCPKNDVGRMETV